MSISANGNSGDGSNGRGSGRDRGVSANESGRRNSGSEDENRLIDQLDEEWDD